MLNNHPSELRLWKPSAILLFVAMLGIYSIIAINAENWLWFRARPTNLDPARIIVVDDGQETLVAPGHPHFLTLSQAVQTAAGSTNNLDLIEIGLSEDSLDYMASDGIMLQVYFDEPVVFNTTFRAGEPTQILIPIEGRHAGMGYFFRGAGGEWWFGAIRMADPLPLYETVETLGYGVAIEMD